MDAKLKLSDKLAIERTVLSAGRSLLAWVRTSLALIGLGFSAYKFLQYLYQEEGVHLVRAQTPRNLGLFMILTGTIPLLLAVWEYARILKKVDRKINFLSDPNLLTTTAVFLFGSFLALVITLKIKLL